MSSLAASRTTTARPSAGRAARSARASQARRVVARASETDEVAMLTKMLELAKERAEAPAAAAPASSDSGDYDGPAFNVLTFNAISSVGLERFPKGRYAISGDGSSFGAEPMAIMLRSHKLQESDVDPSVRGIVRCGAGTNNCNVPKVRGAPRARSARCLDAACLRTRGSAPLSPPPSPAQVPIPSSIAVHESGEGNPNAREYLPPLQSAPRRAYVTALRGLFTHVR